MTEQVELRPTQALWQDYAFLTHELSKFVDKQDMDMFFSLMDQRETMQKMIDAQADMEFAASAGGRILIQEICREEQALAQKLLVLRNQAQHQQRINKAYESFSAIPAGSLMDRGT